MYIKNYNIEFTPKEWKVIRGIIDNSSESCDTAHSFHRAVFNQHGRFDDYTRNTFLCPLLDRLKDMGMQYISFEVSY